MNIKVTRFEYGTVQTDPLLEAAYIVPYRTGYYAEMEFSQTEKPVTVTAISLVFGNGLTIPADRFDPIKVAPDGFRKQELNFFVKDSLAVKKGSYEIQATDASGKIYKYAGQFAASTGVNLI